MPRIKTGLVAAIAALACSGVASAGLVYADFIDDFQDISFFGSGILTGAPDNGGAWLSNTSDPPTNLGFITAGFTGGLVDGAGDDIVIHDCCGGSLPSADEFADVFVSNNGVDFTFLGAYGNGVNSFDLNGVFAMPVFYVKILNTSTQNSPDIDAFQGNYSLLPAPGSLAAFSVVLLARRRRRS
ncbi:MAG: hypothetical protein ACYS0D_11060 [Planctomycetota bacterium]|jgi:hypothetical protein